MTRESIGAGLAALNAILNATSGVLLVLGYRAIRSGRRELHQKLMVSAVAASALFLTSYLTRIFLTGTHRYQGTGALRYLYFTILGTHTILAIIVAPTVLRALFLASKQRFLEHKKLTRWLFPIWLYVSTTGVLVYLMLYVL